MISKDQFEKDYCRESGISMEFYREHFTTLPCDCGAEECEGLASVSNNRISIKTHMEIYAPKADELSAHNGGEV